MAEAPHDRLGTPGCARQSSDGATLLFGHPRRGFAWAFLRWDLVAADWLSRPQVGMSCDGLGGINNSTDSRDKPIRPEDDREVDLALRIILTEKLTLNDVGCLSKIFPHVGVSSVVDHQRADVI
jgi:hypothetical protein